ncbi:MAG: hypothetical protein KAJ52_04750 [Sedimentisphaerales bacterium]|nr:hypothetical protein [Sedimentisphaerales bacterium]
MLKIFTQPTTWMFIGSLIVVFSGLWEAQKSSKEKGKFEKKLNLKNEQLLIKAEQLQNKTEMVSKLSMEIAKQNEFIKESFVGGNSFCYLSFANDSDGLIIPFINHKGKYPLYDIKFRLMDLDLVGIGAKSNNNEKLGDFRKYYDIGNLGPGAVQSLQSFRIQEKELVRLKADISARNGVFIEMIHARKTDKLWHFAIKVIRLHDSKTLFEEIPRSFPTDENGNYNWNEKTEEEQRIKGV